MRIPVTDTEDAEALHFGDITDRGGTPYIKFPAWSRWKRLDVYLTGTVCFCRNGDDWDLRRDNLTPALQPWKSTKRS